MANNICCGRRMRVVEDSCMRMRWECTVCDHAVTQPKRRPRGMPPEVCSWKLFCPAHPNKDRTEHSVQILFAHGPECDGCQAILAASMPVSGSSSSP